MLWITGFVLFALAVLAGGVYVLFKADQSFYSLLDDEWDADLGD